MKNTLLCFAVLTLFAGSAWGAQKKAQEQPIGDEQRFVARQSNHFIAPTEALTNAEANCVIDTAAGAASMRCRPAAVSQSNLHHYDVSLIVDLKGTGYVVACMVSLIEHWCKGFGAGTVVIGTIDQGKLSIADGNKVHNYVVLTSAFVGVPTAAPPPAPVPAAAPVVQAPPASAKAAAAPSPAAPPLNANKPADNAVRASGDSAAACTSAAGACASFVSDPLGADIYVDGKFVGNTPSSVNLAPGSHEIRVESANRKPWTRTLEVSAGSKITIRATLEAASDK